MNEQTSADGIPASSEERLFTGVLNEPRYLPKKSSLLSLKNWLSGLFGVKSKPPSSFNWDTRKVVPTPGDQQETMACVCYANCLAAATICLIRTGKAVSLAPRVMHLCTMGLPLTTGTNSYQLADSAVASGLPYVPDTTDEKRAATLISGAGCSYFDSAPRVKVTGITRFGSADEVKLELSSTGPVVVHMDWYTDFGHYAPDSIYSAPVGLKPVTEHAVCLIGYDDARKCWIGVNSLGPSWGTNGRFLLKYDECGVMARGAAAYALRIQF